MKRIRWTPQTRQQQGRNSEKKLAQLLGARLHPNSGAGHIKHDASSETNLWEFKDADKTYTIHSSEVEELYLRAVKQGKNPAFAIRFRDSGLVMLGTIAHDL